MKKIYTLIATIIIICIPVNNYAFANNNLSSLSTEVSLKLSPNSYTSEGKIKIYSSWYGYDNAVLSVTLDTILKSVPKQTFCGADDKWIEGEISYPNYNDAKSGRFDLIWIFTPNLSDIYETKTGVFHLDIAVPDVIDIADNTEIVEDTTLALTASTLTLTDDTSYDINIQNKQKNSSYAWTSSNAKVASVNKSGVVLAKSEGSTEITCEITTTDEVVTLSADVEVISSDDDNYPTLSETDLNLETGDALALKVENKIVGSTIKWRSTDKTVAKVTSTSGKISALKSGTCNIICTITTDDKSVVVLTCTVQVE